MPYHIELVGSATLNDPAAGTLRQLVAGDILLLPHGSAHILHDGSSKRAASGRGHGGPVLTIGENEGAGERLDMLCGRFVLSAAHERLVRDDLPSHLVVSAAEHAAATACPGTSAQFANLVGLMRLESVNENLGVRAMLNALSTAMFALTLRLASEAPRRLAGAGRASATDLFADFRMTIAANQRRTSSVSTGAVAEENGRHSPRPLPFRCQAAASENRAMSLRTAVS